MEVQNLFQPYEGIKGTDKQRKELCKILFEKQLIAFQEETIEEELKNISDTDVTGIYFSNTVKLFNWDFHMNVTTEISFEEFKKRLTQL